MKKIIYLFAAVFFCCLFLGCGSNAATLKSSKARVFLRTNEEKKLFIRGYNKAPRWRSKNYKIVASERQGFIKAVAPGKTIITTRARKRNFVCTVIVMDINSKKMSLKKGKSGQLNVTHGGSKVKWESSNESVVTVKKGKVKAVGTGKAVVTAIAHGHAFKCRVAVPEVNVSNTSLMAAPPDGVGMISSKSQAKITVKNHMTKPMFSSAKLKLASVTEEGTVTALKGGNASIRISVDGLVYNVKIKVTDRPVDIYLNHLQKYSSYVKKHGAHFQRNDTPTETFQEAKRLVNRGDTAFVNCRAHCCWAFHDMGITPYVIYAKEGTFRSRYKGTMTKYLKRITSGGPVGKNFKQAIDSGALRPGDICTFENQTHTFTYSGIGYLFYDGGTVVSMQGYSNVGLLMDYSSVRYYRNKTISEVLRWNY